MAAQHLNAHAWRDDDRDSAPAGIDAEVDVKVVELSFGEIDCHASKLGTDGRLSRELPPLTDPEPTHPAPDLERLVESAFGRGQRHRRRQGTKHCAELRLRGGSEEPVDGLLVVWEADPVASEHPSQHVDGLRSDSFCDSVVGTRAHGPRS